MTKNDGAGGWGGNPFVGSLVSLQSTDFRARMNQQREIMRNRPD